MAINVEQLSGIAFLAFPEQTELLLSELSSRFDFCEKPESFFGELIYFSNKDSFLEKSGGKYPYWARTVMLNPFILKFDSISEAANHLKSIIRNWAPYQFKCFRRASLIQEKFRTKKQKN